MTVQARFPKEVRLTRSRDFEAIQRSGRRISIAPLRARALRRHASARGSRLGLSIGRQVGGAVERNRWKRAIRQAFRQHRHRLAAPYDIVIAVEWGSSEADVGKVERAFLAIVDALSAGNATGARVPE